MSELLNKLKEIRVVPVVAIDDAADAPALCEALVAGNIPCAEITFRTVAAPEAIKAAAQNPDVLVGAGTVLTLDQARLAVDCGAQFIVSPGISPKVVTWCLDNNVAILPGVATPTDIQLAIELGLGAVKFFPAESYGGIKILKSLAAPYVDMKFMPTGGINAGNIKDYLAFDRVIACGGSWMASGKMIAARQWDEITALSREASELVASV